MKAAAVRQLLQRIQSVVARDTGRPLSLAGEAELEALLRDTDDRSRPLLLEQDFLHQEVTILLADLRGFTAIAAGHPAETVIRMLNPCLIKMSEIIYRHQGSIDKFMGDSIMVLFGAPVSRADDVQRAIVCAVEMQQAMSALNLVHRDEGLPELYMGIGINTGDVLAGTLGSEHYSEYTVIGDEVNLASRIELSACAAKC
ncbi:adenylate/guanylate cyclase domain-containing protein [Methylogaea oryzae]|uniref:adenylate/guanylate cyclase domain-containing protein n=1 Tax=Methylogaea oryzae TaxID=1295382 RepID=UPI000AF7F1FC|nr:adenylate/guanylate cyclase domain-containing protein [Methylogaea oryzae]